MEFDSTAGLMGFSEHIEGPDQLIPMTIIYLNLFDAVLWCLRKVVSYRRPTNLLGDPLRRIRKHLLSTKLKLGSAILDLFHHSVAGVDAGCARYCFFCTTIRGCHELNVIPVVGNR